MQPKQGFATGISQPYPAQHGDVPEAARSEAQQGFATGISQPHPAQHGDVPEAARSKAKQKQGPKRKRNKVSPSGSSNRNQPSTSL
jgi:hypothetical protein